MDSKFKNMETSNVDPITSFVKGSKSYNDYYFPKIEKNEEPAAPLIDKKTGFIVGSKEYNDYYFPIFEKPGGRHR